jgi:hypothetical protein
MLTFYDLDDLAKAMRLIAKYIGRDWNRLYWQLPYYPSRGKEEVSRDINHIDDKYHRGDVFHVNIVLINSNSFIYNCFI